MALNGPVFSLRTGHALIASLCALAAALLAAHHPLWPVQACVLLCVWALLAFRWPDLWLLVVPAALPFLNLSPWTGWLACDEFDLLLLGGLAAGHLRLARTQQLKNSGTEAAGWARWRRGLVLAFGGWALISLSRGLVDAGDLNLDPFQGYTSAMNSLRVGKSMLYALLAAPLLRAALGRSAQTAARLLCSGVIVGLIGAMCVVLWERAAFPGLWDFSDNYRVTAMFWDMHVGGAAIDGYLALATPFVGWALWSTRRPWQWATVSLLALAVGYASLTTFSRGVYLSVLGGVVVAGGLVRLQKTDFDPIGFWRRLQERVRPARWRIYAGIALSIALALEVVFVLGTGSFLAERLAASNRDFGSRWHHWTRGVALLNGPADWLLGKGLGRLPAHYAAAGPRGEFSGAVDLNAGSQADGREGDFVTLRGPATQRILGGLYALTQRVPLLPDAQYQIAMDIRVQRPVDVGVQVCERHLLYEGDCQGQSVRLEPNDQPWQHLVLPLDGPPLSGGEAWLPRPVMLSVALLNRHSIADVDNLSLTAGTSRDLLSNGGFSAGMAHWFPAAQYYFLPWHIDNLYLEWLIEHGAIGLLLFVLLMGSALWRLVLGPARHLAIAPYLAASISGGLAVGLVSSVMDAPRVAFLLQLFAFWALQSTARPVSPVSTDAVSTNM